MRLFKEEIIDMGALICPWSSWNGDVQLQIFAFLDENLKTIKFSDKQKFGGNHPAAVTTNHDQVAPLPGALE